MITEALKYLKENLLSNAPAVLMDPDRDLWNQRGVLTLGPLERRTGQAPLDLYSLGGFAAYLADLPDEIDANPAYKVLVTCSYDRAAAVLVLDQTDVGRQGRRTLACAEALAPVSDPGLMHVEEARRWIQASCAPSPDRDTLVNLLEHIVVDDSVTLIDNGLGQKVEYRSGVETVRTEALLPSYELRPYRTFRELEQPVTPYVVRLERVLTDGKYGSRVDEAGDQVKVRLYAADGAAWRPAAAASVAKHLRTCLASYDRVTVY